MLAHFIAVLLTLSPATPAVPDSLPLAFVREAGLASTENATEVRIWVWGGIGYPFSFYRVIQDHDEVRGDFFLWADIEKPRPDLITKREARNFNSDVRKIMQKSCDQPVLLGDDFMWCRAKLTRKVRWKILFDDLLPQELLTLPQELERDCGSTTSDGFVVDIQIVTPDQANYVSYGNPDFCCAHLACALANNAKRLAERRIK